MKYLLLPLFILGFSTPAYTVQPIEVVSPEVREVTHKAFNAIYWKGVRDGMNHKADDIGVVRLTENDIHKLIEGDE